MNFSEKPRFREQNETIKAMLRLLLSTCFLIVRAAHAASVVPATPLDRPAPDFPAAVGQAAGSVKLRFDIDRDGRTRNLVVLESVPKALFDAAAIAAVSRWLYRPRLVEGAAVEQVGNLVTLKFQPDSRPQRNLIYEGNLYYPRDAYAARIEGSIKVVFDIAGDGRTMNVRLAEGQLPSAFAVEAVKNVDDWIFQPDKDGHPDLGLTTVLHFRINEAHLRPVPAHPIAPAYPIAAINSGIMGNCAVQFSIETDGSISDAHIVTCYPRGVFEEASLQAVRAGSFRPERDPALNRKRTETLNIKYRFANTPESDVRYLKPGQWIELKYRLTKDGRARDIEVVRKSQPDLGEFKAIRQLQDMSLAPAMANGVAVEKLGQLITISGG